MLRRRIFSSAMASVMALSSVAVVANAEDAQYKSKAELEKLVYETYGDTFRTDELSEYGSVSADAVLDALEAAEAILNDDDKDEADYTVAYMMVEATVSRLVIYTAEELDALIKKCTSIYESNNIYNEELQDRIYTIGSYDALVQAYENAGIYVTSSSSSDITEAYEQLNAAYGNLVKETVVSKSMFRSVMKQYEAIIDDEFKYETWRRGSFGGWADLNSGNYWILTSTSGVSSFGLLWEAMISLKDDINSAYESIDAIKTLSKTSDEDIVAGYKMAQDAVAVYNGWTVDSTSRATKSGVNQLLKQYHGCLVYDFARTSAQDLYNAILEANGVNDEGKYNMKEEPFVPTYGAINNYQGWGAQTKLVDAKWNIKSTVNVYVPVDADGFWTGAKLAVGTRPDESTLPAGAEKWQLISAKTNFDIAKLIKVQTEDVINGVSYVIVDENGDPILNDAGEEQYYNAGDNFSGGVWADPATNAVLDQGSEWLYGWGTVVYGEAEGYLPADKVDVASGIAYDATTKQYTTVNDKGETVGTSYSRIMLDLMNYTADNGGDDVATIINLSTAYGLAMDYLDGDKKYSSMTDDIDTTGVVADNVADGTSKEWAIVYRYLKYALDDKYSAVVSDEKYTRADVKKLIDDCYDLADLTGDAAIFEKTHNIMVEARQVAKDWLAAANSDKLYKEYTAGKDADGDDYDPSTVAYKALHGAYEALLNEYNAMKYSFGDIYNKIADVTAMIDDGDLEATTELLAALDETAYRLSVVSDIVNENYDENPAFDVDRMFQPHNRVITNTGDPVTIATINEGVTTKDGANPTHAALATAYDALLAAVDAQLAPAALLGDVDGNGTVNALDASALLVNTVNGVTMDAAVADYDKNGSINALDASAILIAIVNGTV